MILGANSNLSGNGLVKKFSFYKSSVANKDSLTSVISKETTRHKMFQTLRLKVVYLAIRVASKKWARPIKNWRLALKRLVLSLVSGSTSTSKKEFTQTIYTLLFIVLNKEFLFWGIDLYFKLKSL